MRPVFIIIDALTLNLLPRIGSRDKHVRIQIFTPEPAVESLNRRIRTGFPDRMNPV
jgi:hypothetical protein